MATLKPGVMWILEEVPPLTGIEIYVVFPGEAEVRQKYPAPQMPKHVQ